MASPVLKAKGSAWCEQILLFPARPRVSYLSLAFPRGSPPFYTVICHISKHLNTLAMRWQVGAVVSAATGLTFGAREPGGIGGRSQDCPCPSPQPPCTSPSLLLGFKGETPPPKQDTSDFTLTWTSTTPGGPQGQVRVWGALHPACVSQVKRASGPNSRRVLR